MPGSSSPRRSAYTLLEMLTTVAVLVIVLGLMVSLARHVRERAAVALTKDLIRRLDVLMERYAGRNEGRLPDVSPFPPHTARDPYSEASPGGAPGDSPYLHGPATAPDPDAVAARRPGENGARPRGPGASADASRDPSRDSSRPEAFDRRVLSEAARVNNKEFVAALRRDPTLTATALKDMPVSMYDESHLRDAWGSPIVFMPSMHPLVGTAPRDRSFFFFSAGPDRRYLTQEDNLYSYEERVTGVK